MKYYEIYWKSKIFNAGGLPQLVVESKEVAEDICRRHKEYKYVERDADEK